MTNSPESAKGPRNTTGPVLNAGEMVLIDELGLPFSALRLRLAVGVDGARVVEDLGAVGDLATVDEAHYEVLDVDVGIRPFRDDDEERLARGV